MDKPMNQSQPNKLNPVAYWVMCHVRACLFSIGNLWRTPFATIMTLLVIGISTALPSGLYLVLKNFQHISNQWHNSPTISLYLNKQVNNADIPQLTQELKQNKAIANVQYISPEQGLQQFEKETQFNGALTSLSNNPIPAVFVVTPTENYQAPEKLQQLMLQLKSIPQVDTGQIDLAWIKRLYYIITLAKRITYAMAFIFALGVVVIIGNTIRLTTQNHRQEINVLKLVGATRGFIRRPFLYRGILYGVLGSIIAILIISSLMLWLQTPADNLANSYNNTLGLSGLSFNMIITILVAGGALGWVGSWIAVDKHLRAAENA